MSRALVKKAQVCLSLLAVAAFHNAAAGTVCDFTTETFGNGTGQAPAPPANTTDLSPWATCSVAASKGTGVLQVPGSQVANVGTGVIDPFLTTKTPNGNAGSESGFNTDYSDKPLPLDIMRLGQKGDVGFTNSVLLGDVPIVAFQNRLYREFFLDFNQEASSPYLSLDVLRLFLSNDPDAAVADGYSIAPKGFDAEGFVQQDGQNLGQLVWSLDDTTDRSILLDYRICQNGALLGTCPKPSGPNGSGLYYDLRVLIPNEAFSFGKSTDYLLFYTSYGWAACDMQGPLKTVTKTTGGKGKKQTTTTTTQPTQRCFDPNDGFEEWAFREGGACVYGNCSGDELPEPGTLALLGLGLAGIGLTRRRRREIAPNG